MQLSEANDQFQDLQINIITATYDSNEDAKKFHRRSNIAFPIVQDVDSAMIKKLGILNTGPQPGDGAYGIPYPGIFLVDHEGVIRAKFAEKSFRDRPELEDLLKAAANL